MNEPTRVRLYRCTACDARFFIRQKFVDAINREIKPLHRYGFEILQMIIHCCKSTNITLVETGILSENEDLIVSTPSKIDVKTSSMEEITEESIEDLLVAVSLTGDANIIEKYSYRRFWGDNEEGK